MLINCLPYPTLAAHTWVCEQEKPVIRPRQLDVDQQALPRCQRFVTRRVTNVEGFVERPNIPQVGGLKPMAELALVLIRSSSQKGVARFWLTIGLQHRLNSHSTSQSWKKGSRVGSMTDTPFGDPVTSVPLKPHSLVFVVAQIRFPLVVSINEERFVGPFQELIRSDYPELERATEAQVLLGPDGVQKVEGGVVWTFSAAQDGWQVALTPSFVALSTPTYTNRDDFLSRLDTLLALTEQWLKPRRVTRFGVRYVDRIDGAKLDRLTEFVRTEVLGPIAVELGEGASLRHSITECSYDLEHGNTFRARWGRLPAGASLDPSVPPVKSASWVLDLDAAVENVDFDRAELTARAATFGDVIYRYYRWAVTSEFLRAHGGQL